MKTNNETGFIPNNASHQPFGETVNGAAATLPTMYLEASKPVCKARTTRYAQGRAGGQSLGEVEHG